MWGEAKLNAFVPLLQHAFNSLFKPGKKGKASTVQLPFLVGWDKTPNIYGQGLYTTLRGSEGDRILRLTQKHTGLLQEDHT